MTIGIVEQIKAAERELMLRKRVFPKWVNAGRMKQQTMDHEIAAMESIIETLKLTARITELANQIEFP